MRNVLTHTPLRRLFTAQVPADFADWLDYVAITALLAFVWDAPLVAFAWFAVAMGLPYLIIGPFAGMAVDRAPVRAVLFLSNVGRGIATLGLFLAPDWPTLMLVVALRSSVDTFFTPAKQAAIQALTTTDTRMAANGLSQAINQTSKIAGPALGGALMIWLTPQSLFLANAGVSVLAAVLMLRLEPLPRAPAEQGPQGFWVELTAGLTEMRARPVLRAALLIMAGGFAAMFFYDTLFAPLTRALKLTETDLGLGLAAVGAGGVAGAMLVARSTTAPFLWVAGATLVSAILIAWLGLVEIVGAGMARGVFLVIFLVLGLTSSLALVPIRTVIQTTTPAARIGRVTALSEALNTCALLTAPFAGAALAAATTLGVAFVAGAAIMVAVALWAAQSHRRYRAS